MLAIVFSVFCLTLAVRQKLQVDVYKDELGLILQEASAVKDELETIMSSTVELSKSVADNIDSRLNEYRQVVEQQSPAGEASRSINLPTGLDSSKPAPGGRRIYEIARDMNITSKELIIIIRSQGIKVKNHLSVADPEIVTSAVKQANGANILPSAGIRANAGEIQTVQGDGPGETIRVVPLQTGESQEWPPEEDAYVAVPGSYTGVRDGMDFSMEELRQAHPYIAVRTLHERGLAVWEIAKLLDRGQGEISLILKLTGKKQAQSF